MSGLPVVHVDDYRSWRAWFRTRYRVQCGVCGDQAAEIMYELEALRIAGRHAAWHGLLAAILATYREP
jgi:hypothetical protein